MRKYRIYSNARLRSSIFQLSAEGGVLLERGLLLESVFQRLEKVALFHELHISAILEEYSLLFFASSLNCKYQPDSQDTIDIEQEHTLRAVIDVRCALLRS